MTPAWLPVYDRAWWPRLAMAMASSAIEMRSPAVSSMSSSRPGGSGLTCWARSTSSSVVSPMADTTTTTSWPALRVSTMRLATRLMPSASATDEPPYFCTTRPTGASSATGIDDCLPSRETVDAVHCTEPAPATPGTFRSPDRRRARLSVRRGPARMTR